MTAERKELLEDETPACAFESAGVLLLVWAVIKCESRNSLQNRER